MKLILPFLIVILFSYSLSSFLKLKSIESIFFGLILIINSLLILTYIFGLRVAVYIICLVTAFLLITNIIYCIKKKKFASHVIEFFNNPAFVIFVLIISVYSALIYDNHLFSWDDYSHWGLAVKAIYEFDGFNITQGILGPQTLGMPIFNSFIISVAGYKEGYMLCGLYIGLLYCCQYHVWAGKR